MMVPTPPTAHVPVQASGVMSKVEGGGEGPGQAPNPRRRGGIHSCCTDNQWPPAARLPLYPSKDGFEGVI